jgi:hypothetical protein
MTEHHASMSLTTNKSIDPPFCAGHAGGYVDQKYHESAAAHTIAEEDSRHAESEDFFGSLDTSYTGLSLYVKGLL